MQSFIQSFEKKIILLFSIHIRNMNRVFEINLPMT
jgi:hypothetical protein